MGGAAGDKMLLLSDGCVKIEFLSLWKRFFSLFLFLLSWTIDCGRSSLVGTKLYPCNGR